jgi:hypothetical protein
MQADTSASSEAPELVSAAASQKRTRPYHASETTRVRQLQEALQLIGNAGSSPESRRISDLIKTLLQIMKLDGNDYRLKLKSLASQCEIACSIGTADRGINEIESDLTNVVLIGVRRMLHGSTIFAHFQRNTLRYLSPEFIVTLASARSFANQRMPEVEAGLLLWIRSLASQGRAQIRLIGEILKAAQIRVCHKVNLIKYIMPASWQLYEAMRFCVESLRIHFEVDISGLASNEPSACHQPAVPDQFQNLDVSRSQDFFRASEPKAFSTPMSLQDFADSIAHDQHSLITPFGFDFRDTSLHPFWNSGHCMRQLALLELGDYQAQGSSAKCLPLLDDFVRQLVKSSRIDSSTSELLIVGAEDIFDLLVKNLQNSPYLNCFVFALLGNGVRGIVGDRQPVLFVSDTTRSGEPFDHRESWNLCGALCVACAPESSIEGRSEKVQFQAISSEGLGLVAEVNIQTVCARISC